MSLFQFQWLRKFIRNNTRPVPIPRAALVKERLSIIYALFAWNAFGFVCYAIYKGKNDWAAYHGISKDDGRNLSPAQKWAEVLGMKNAAIYRVSGFNVEKLDNPLHPVTENKDEVNSASTVEDNIKIKL